MDTAVEKQCRSDYYPALDGLRAVAVLLVFFHHYGVYSGQPLMTRWYDGGWIGVDLFFVLSGFLITGILYDSRQKSHALRGFYIRRILRIWPLYYGVIAVLALNQPIMHWTLVWEHVLWPLHLGNYARFFMPAADPYLSDELRANVGGRFIGLIVLMRVQLGHFWSLCVEEQFYLLWPLVVYRVGDRKRLIKVSLGVICCVPVIRLLCFQFASANLLQLELVYRSLFTRADALILGGLAALLLRGPEREWIERHRRTLVFASVIPALTFGFYVIAGTTNRLLPPLQSRFAVTLGYTFLDLAAAGIILELIHPSSWLSKVFSLTWLRRLGVVSYGFYVFHDLPHQYYIGVSRRFLPHAGRPGLFAIAFTGTLTLTILSYHLYEKHFLRLKQKFAVNVPRAPQI